MEFDRPTERLGVIRTLGRIIGRLAVAYGAGWLLASSTAVVYVAVAIAAYGDLDQALADGRQSAAHRAVFASWLAAMIGGHTAPVVSGLLVLLAPRRVFRRVMVRSLLPHGLAVVALSAAWGASIVSVIPLFGVHKWMLAAVPLSGVAVGFLYPIAVRSVALFRRRSNDSV